ncbi:7TM diverse intracellular signaling domain-containing protein [Bernardetia sp.]|uniref:7TM diverse intracellular signaling domain-containing protein n=1 Tax=Bernardetia sp. TaxID=1937974 RepID=UPI0025C12166|nr:7TM diverse intracellular signaling domain-containing protein [Bernardetia sp.]
MLCSSELSLAQSLPSILLEDKNQEYIITNKLGVYEEVISDTIKKETIEIIQSKNFKVFEKDILSINSGKHILWVKIPFQNNSELEKWYLEIGNGLADIDIFIPQNKEEKSSIDFEKTSMGFSLPFDKRFIKTNVFLIPIKLPKNEVTTIYLRIESDYFQAPFRIAPVEYYLERNHKIDLAEGIYYGFAIVMVLYNLFIFFTLKEKSYLYYLSYLLFLALAMAQLRGHFFEFLVFDLPIMNRYVPMIHSLSGIFASLFLIDFLNTKKNSHFFHTTLHIVISIFSLALIVSLLGFKPIASLINQIIAGLSTINALAAAIFIYYIGYKPAKYIIVGWSFYLIGVLLFVLAGAEIIPYNSFTSNGVLFGSAIEMILLSVALAAKIDFYKKGKEELQGKMLELIENENKRLEKRVNERTEELNVVNEELSINLERLNEQHLLIEKKNQDITSSITYAKRIQDAMLPSLEEIRKCLPNSFILFKPKDIVSGDFYYFKQVHQKIIIGVIDCTGHGVPGAFMSLIGNDLLNEIVELKSVTKASHILDRLNQGVVKALRQTDTQVRDGMDAAICVYDIETQILEYAGAKNPMIYVQNGELKVIKADRQSIGGSLIKNEFNKKPFTTHTIHLKDNQDTIFYLFSDGFQDQFGGENDKKFTIKRFRNTLLEASKLPLNQQKEFLHTILLDWMNEETQQIDDILVVGFNCLKTIKK